MPDALWDYDGVTRFDGECPIASRLFQDYVDPTGDKVENLISVRMNFASMRRIPPHVRSSDGVSVDTRRWPTTSFEHPSPTLTVERQISRRQIDRCRERAHRR